jgi:asparagine synthase (glutamine-hydrolysing)
MTQSIEHRGPDDGGSWLDPVAGIALGHRRLAIVDTSLAGHQPMMSENGRFILVFNGEIYNHPDLREELASAGAAPRWRGHSDTETLLAGLSRWGLKDTLRRAAGMFALAVWDRQSGELMLARDRFGEKPLYYGWAGGTLIFGSELKSLRAHPRFESRLCFEALEQYLRFGYVPSPRSIWQHVYKLEPGCILTIAGSPACLPRAPLRPGLSGEGFNVERYWSFSDVTEAGHQDLIRDDAEAVEQLDALLDRAVRRQLLSDVPLGAFLSGGIDSSLIVALMQKNSVAPVRTFSVGFEEKEFDESPHAAAVARHIGTQHTEIRVTAGEARAVIPRLAGIFDEPFADASQIPTLLICQAARPHVSVALTGDAGDELFGGYARYQRVPALWNSFSAIPFAVRRSLGAAIATVPASWWGGLTQLQAARRKAPPIADRLQRLGTRFSNVRSLDDLYLNFVASWPEPGLVAAFMNGARTGVSPLLDDPLPRTGLEDPAARMMYFDALTYLPDDILCKVDRTAMSVSLETRAPLLDPDVVALAARLPASMKIRGGQGKWALRQVLYRYVPQAIIDRPKLGFFLPIGQWLRGPLRDWAEALLDPARLAEQGVFAPEVIARIWAEHVSGRRDWTLQMWTVLMFEAWADEHLRAKP